MDIISIFHFESYTYKPLHDFSSKRIIKGRLGDYRLPKIFKIFNPLFHEDKDYLITLKLL